MTQYTLRTLLKNKVLWIWPAIFLFFALAIFNWGGISSAQNSYSFMVMIGDAPLPSGILINDFLISIVTLIAVIGMPGHLAENLEPKRAALLLSKPISRSELYFSDIAAMLLASFFYTLVSLFLLAVLVAVEAAIFPYQLFGALLFLLPLLLLTYYITIVFFLTLTDSYLASVILGYFLAGFSTLFLDMEKFLQMVGWDNIFAETLATGLSYLVPSAAGVQQLLDDVLSNGFSSFDGGLFIFILVSCLPLLALGCYFIREKEF